MQLLEAQPEVDTYFHQEEKAVEARPSQRTVRSGSGEAKESGGKDVPAGEGVPRDGGEVAQVPRVPPAHGPADEGVLPLLRVPSAALHEARPVGCVRVLGPPEESQQRGQAAVGGEQDESADGSGYPDGTVHLVENLLATLQHVVV